MWGSFIAWVTKRDADFVIGGRDNPYMFRWWVIPRNRFFNIYLHHIVRSDDDRALHDHPWVSLSRCLAGEMQELDANGVRTVRAGQWRLRGPRYAHRLVVADGASCWTLFITGPRLREWGFYCPQGWVHWQDFTAGKNGELVGRGCGETT